MITRIQLRERIRRIPAGGRLVIAFVIAIAFLNALAWSLDRAAGGSGPGGATSSSFATADDGLAAYASLLERFGYDVQRQRGTLGETALELTTTFVLLDPGDLETSELRTLRRFVELGGILVAGGRFPAQLVGGVLDDPPTWTATGPETAHSLGDDPRFEGLTDIVTAGEGSWTDPGATNPVVGGGDGDLVDVARLGSGQLVLLADVSPLQNQLLAEADNAAFGLALAGDDGGTVRFAEGVHGFGETTGVAAIPTRWKVALGGLVLAALVGMWAKGRRLGPAEETERPLPPPRAAYVDALATTLARTKEPAAAMAPIQAALADTVRQSAALPPDADEAELRRAAVRLGWPPEEVDVMRRAAGKDADLLAAGRALARLQSRSQGGDP